MALGLGTAALGRPQYINIRQKDVEPTTIELFKKHGFNVLEEAYKLGVRYFDTAPGYGLAEELVSDWLQTKNDSTIKVATKWGYTYVANFDKNAKIHEIKEHSLSKLKEQWNVSKMLLPYLKVYQIHSATIETSVLNNNAILEHLSYLKNEFNLEIGITTTGPNQTEVLKKAVEVIVNGSQLFDAFQVTYNILDQSLITVLKELKNKKIIVKEALANGRIFRNKKYPHYNNLYNTLELLAKKHSVDVDAIALKFCELTVSNSIILSGASNNHHLQSNVKVNTFSLTEEEITVLKKHKVDTINYWLERKKLNWN